MKDKLVTLVANTLLHISKVYGEDNVSLYGYYKPEKRKEEKT